MQVMIVKWCIDDLNEHLSDTLRCYYRLMEITLSPSPSLYSVETQVTQAYCSQRLFCSPQEYGYQQSTAFTAPVLTHSRAIKTMSVWDSLGRPLGRPKPCIDLCSYKWDSMYSFSYVLGWRLCGEPLTLIRHQFSCYNWTTQLICKHFMCGSQYG